MNPNFDFNLQRLAMFSIGRTIWEGTQITTKIKEWFDTHFYCKKPFTPSGLWHKLVRKLMSQIREEFTLSEHLKRELCDVVKEMGLRLFDWLMHVKLANFKYYGRLHSTYWENIQCPLKIHWTLNCTIDVKKTVEESWAKNPNLEHMCANYHMAVSYGLHEDFVNKLWNAMSKWQQGMYRGLFNVDYAVNAYYEYHRNGQLNQLKINIEQDLGAYRSFITWNPHLTFTENMLITFVREGFTEAAKLMWGRLNESARARVLEDSALAALACWSRPLGEYTSFARRQCAELSIFFLNLLSSERKRTLFAGRALEILKMFAVTWPWNGFFIEIYDEFWEYYGQDGDYSVLLLYIVDRLVREDNRTDYVIEGSKNQQLFQECWMCIPKDERLKDPFRLEEIFIKLIKMRDMTSATMICSSPEAAPSKSYMLKSATNLFEDMIVENKIELLDKFIDDNLKTEDEKKTFKQSLAPYEKLILKIPSNNRFVLADKCLDWQSENKIERDAIKLNIDYHKIGRDAELWQRKIVASKFLDWVSSCLEKQENGNNLNCQFSNKDTIYKLWNRLKFYVPEGNKKGVEFCDWFFALELEITPYLSKRTVSESMVILLVDAILKQQYYNIVDHLMHWCSMTEQEVKHVREKIMKESKLPICRHYIEASEIQISRGFLNWIENKEERISFINHFVANKGSTSCYKFIATEGSILTKKESKFRDFIKTWIKPLDDDRLRLFKKVVRFQAIKSKRKHSEDCKNYDIFQCLLKEIT